MDRPNSDPKLAGVLPRARVGAAPKVLQQFRSQDRARSGPPECSADAGRPRRRGSLGTRRTRIM